MSQFHRVFRKTISALSLCWLGVSALSTSAWGEERKLLELDPSKFSRPLEINNEWWPLVPGTQHVYEGWHIEDGKKIGHRLVETVTDLVKVIKGVPTQVTLELDYSKGKLTEKEIVFHAQDNAGNVWHFGQLVEIYEDGHFVGGRIWLVDNPAGAKAGIRMLAKPRLGTRDYSQGYAPPPFNWTDRARIFETGAENTVAHGTYKDVMIIEEWDEETDKGVFQIKYYAKGVGVIRVGFRGPDPDKEELQLVSTRKLTEAEMEEVRADVLGVEGRAMIYATLPPVERDKSVKLSGGKH